MVQKSQVRSVNVEAISAETSAVGVTINLSNQTEGFTITGSAFADTITGSSAADFINGGAGDDILNGGDGNDTMIGGAGKNTFIGGDGIDTVTYASAKMALGINLQTTGPHGDIYSGIENLIGGMGGDTLIGTDGENKLEGREGNDTLLGGFGDDVLIGGMGNDILWGDFGPHLPGAGADTFVFETGGGNDHILDYVIGEDKLDFSNVAGVHSFSDLHFTYIDSPTTINGALIDWGVAGESVLVRHYSVEALQAHQSDFIFA